jgi:hypothetical protein
MVTDLKIGRRGCTHGTVSRPALSSRSIEDSITVQPEISALISVKILVHSLT